MMMSSRTDGTSSSDDYDVNQLPRDIRDFLSFYCDRPQDPFYIDLYDNLKFYQNRILLETERVTISHIHVHWFGMYHILESSCAVVEWLFPIREQSRHADQHPLTLFEIAVLTAQHKHHVLRSLVLMLDFYGLQFDYDSLRVRRNFNYWSRYAYLEHSLRDCRRITRILKCLSELSLEVVGVSWLLFILVEQSRGMLSGVALFYSVRYYWRWCFRSRANRQCFHDLLSQMEWNYALPEERYCAMLHHYLQTSIWDTSLKSFGYLEQPMDRSVDDQSANVEDDGDDYE